MSNNKFEGGYRLECVLYKIDNPEIRINISHSQVASCIIQESIHLPMMQAELIINDAVGLYETFNFTGNEAVVIKWSADFDIKDNVTYTNSHVFHVYNVSPTVKTGTDKIAYALKLVSIEYFANYQAIVSKQFSGPIPDIIGNIVKDYWGAQSIREVLSSPSEETNLTFISNFWDPLKCIIYATRHLLDDDGFPGFVFYEDRGGYKLVSLNTACSSSKIDHKLTINKVKLDHKNNDELESVLDAQYHIGFDFMDRLTNGFYGGVEIAYDPVTGVYSEFTIDITDKNAGGKTFKTLNKIVDSSHDLKVSPLNHYHVIPRSFNTFEHSDYNSDENIRIAREQMMSRLDTQILKVKVWGSNIYTLNTKIKVNVPKSSIPNEVDAHNSMIKDLDKKLSGNYLVTSIDHIFAGQYNCILQLNKGSYIE